MKWPLRLSTSGIFEGLVVAFLAAIVFAIWDRVKPNGWPGIAVLAPFMVVFACAAIVMFIVRTWPPRATPILAAKTPEQIAAEMRDWCLQTGRGIQPVPNNDDAKAVSFVVGTSGRLVQVSIPRAGTPIPRVVFGCRLSLGPNDKMKYDTLSAHTKRTLTRKIAIELAQLGVSNIVGPIEDGVMIANEMPASEVTDIDAFLTALNLVNRALTITMSVIAETIDTESP